jgi:plasmid stabilization system protein ParE
LLNGSRFITPRMHPLLNNAFAPQLRLARWPESGRRSAKRQGVRTVLVGRYPYRIFYRITADAVEILHIHHAAREPWDEVE